MVKEPTLSIVSANVLRPILYLYCLLAPISRDFTICTRLFLVIATHSINLKTFWRAKNVE